MIVLCPLQNAIKPFRPFSELENLLETTFYAVDALDNSLYNGVSYFYKMNVLGFDEL